MEQQKVILSRIAKRIDIFQTCQEIKSLRHRLLDLTISTRAKHSCSDEDTYSIDEILIRLCSHFDMLSEELTILYALEHLDKLKGGRYILQSPQNGWIGILVPFQAVSSLSFKVFRHFQVYDSLIITAILVLLIDNDIGIQVRYIMSFMRFIIAQTASGNGKSYLEEGFTKLPAKETTIVYNWISANTATGQVLEYQKLHSDYTLYELWKSIQPLMLRRLDCLSNLDLNGSRRDIELSLDQKSESYADHLFNFTYIKYLCNDMINCYPSSCEYLTRVVHTDSFSIGDIFRYTQGLLYASIDATTTCRIIKKSWNLDGEPLSNENDSCKAVASSHLEILANLAQSQAGVETVTQSLLDFDIIPYLMKSASSDEKEIRFNATVILQKLFERPITFHWLVYNESASQIQSMVFKLQETTKYIESALACQLSGLVNELRRSWDRLLYLSDSPTADENLINLKQLLVYLQIYLWELSLNDHRLVFRHRLNSFLQPSEFVKMQTFFLSNLQAIVQISLLESYPEAHTKKANSCKVETLGKVFKAHQAMNGNEKIQEFICSLCEILALLAQLIRRSCAYVRCDHSEETTHKNHLDDNSLLATFMIDAALTMLCTTSDLSKVLFCGFRGGRKYSCLKYIFTVEEEIYSMLHDQCSISLIFDNDSADDKPARKTYAAYESLGIAPNLPKYIIKNALEIIQRKPTSVLPLLKLISDLLPDAVGDDMKSLSSSSQHLRSYWKTALAELCDDLLILRHFIISNDHEISESASVVLARVCQLFSDHNGFQHRIKSMLYHEMNAHLRYALHLRSTDAVLYHKQLELMQNEVVLRRWLNFTAKPVELCDIHMYFIQALDRIGLPAQVMQRFTSSGEDSTKLYHKARNILSKTSKCASLKEPPLFVMLNLEFVFGIINKVTCLTNERKELYKERDRNVQDAMYSKNISNNKTNIGGGKAYIRNEFRAVHGVQSVNASRPPSVHVDEFSILQS
ncbi:hypothetical protein INT43_001004 [Umbelopsis isabellina]|uniref:Uncharacterized protein n=1 Tax=Mortierella isabellina TaxID=91625 RepID=A0A8H7UGN3_MORIS|nr:hypothetical protein INT43_001004 [Umbelopsis isabellina]